MTKGTVLVTGASGYIAGFVIQSLIADGWTVRGTVRSLAKADAVHRTLGVAPAQLPLIGADLSRDVGWADAVAGVDYVHHIASPLPAGAPKTDDELIVPARDGALRVLAAAQAAGVRRVVMTSSAAAICYGMDGPRRVFTEADWTDPTHPDTYAYVKSKTIAERAARDWMAAHGGAMEFVTINPSAVLGPVLGHDFSPSLELVKRLMDGSLPLLPNFGFAVVDVRDIARAHLAAMTLPGMANERFLCAGQFLWMRDVAHVLKARLGDKAKRVPTRMMPDFLLRLIGRFDRQVAMVVPEVGRERICDAGHARDALGWVPRPAEESIVDTARSLLAAGLVRT